MTKQLRKEDQRIVLDELKIETGNKVQPTAKIRLLIDGKPVETTAHGIGSVDAVANAIKSIVPESISLEEYTLKAVTGGTDALADVVVKIADSHGKFFEAEAINEDVVMASANALIKALNKALAKDKKE